jgi:hypothetical protein
VVRMTALLQRCRWRGGAGLGPAGGAHDSPPSAMQVAGSGGVRTSRWCACVLLLWVARSVGPCASGPASRAHACTPQSPRGAQPLPVNGLRRMPGGLPAASVCRGQSLDGRCPIGKVEATVPRPTACWWVDQGICRNRHIGQLRQVTLAPPILDGASRGWFRSVMGT